MYKRLILLAGFATLVLSACGAMTTRAEGTPVAGATEILNIMPAATYEGWKTFDSGLYTFKYPSSFYVPASSGPAFSITDSKTTYDSWAANGIIPTSELLISFVSLNLDRKLDPYNNPGLLAAPELALQREINRYFGIPYLVSASINVPWENANGGTDDGRKWFYPNVTYENVMLGPARSARVISDREIGYFILNPRDDSYYVRLSINPAGSTLLKVADEILSSFKFSH